MDKTVSAYEVIKKCLGRKGFYASHDKRYYFGQYWTRDLFFSLELLLSLGYEENILSQFELIRERQKRSGEIPAIIIEKLTPDFITFHLGYFLEELAFFIQKGRYRTTNYSWFGLEKLLPAWFFGVCPWTGDNEILYVSGLYDFFNKIGYSTVPYKTGTTGVGKFKNSIVRAAGSVERKLDSRFGLPVGTGWMDLMKNFDGKILLLNSILLWKMYDCLGWRAKNVKVKELINSPIFWDEKKKYYKNFAGGDKFDCLACVLGLEYKIFPEDRITFVVEKLDGLLGPGGYLNIDRPYSIRKCGWSPHYFQNSVSWPFITARVIETMKKLGFDKEAKRGFEVFSGLKGHNEWYSPAGNPHGSKDQLWSAAGWVSVKDLF